LAQSKKKNFYLSNSFWRLLLNKKNTLKKNKKLLFSKASVIPFSFKNKEFLIYKGNIAKTLIVNKFMINFKFGEFIFTRKPFYFPLKESKKKKFLKR